MMIRSQHLITGHTGHTVLVAECTDQFAVTMVELTTTSVLQIVTVACLPVEVVQPDEAPSGPPWSPPSSSATPTLLSLLFVGPFVGLAYVAGTATRLGLWSFWWGVSFATAAEPSPPDLLLLLLLLRG